MSDKDWMYLGDGVYSKIDQFGIMLHANSHDEPTDKIYLEWTVLEAIVRILLAKKRKEEKQGA